MAELGHGIGVIPSTVDQEIQQNFMAPSNFYAASGNWARKSFSVAADRYKILMPNDGAVKISDSLYGWNGQPILDLSSGAFWDTLTGTDGTVAANRLGKNIFSYLVPPADGTTVPKPLFSFNASAPYGYTVSNSRRVAGLHGLCMAIDHATRMTAWTANTVIAVGQTRRATVWDGYIYICVTAGTTHATTEPTWSGIVLNGVSSADGTVVWRKQLHGLEGYVVGDVPENYVWNEGGNRPSCSPDGMVRVPGRNNWWDIYLPSGTGANTASVYGATISDTRFAWQFMADFAAVGKVLIPIVDFDQALVGSSWRAKASLAYTTGGFYDADGRALISSIGVVDGSGRRFQFTSFVISATTRYCTASTDSAHASPWAISGNAHDAATNYNFSSRGCCANAA
jgi:hypothetical protein